MIDLARAQALPLVTAEEVKRTLGVESEKTRRLVSWQDFAIRGFLVCVLSFAAFGPVAQGGVLVLALGLAMVTQGKPVLEGLGSLLSAIARSIGGREKQ